MRAVVQRVSRAEVLVDGRVVGRCGKGLLVLVGAHRDDAHGNAVTMADRVYGLRVFNDGEGKMNRSLRELQDEGEDVSVLAVSNFTVYGETSKNRRPSFMAAAPYEHGQQVFESFLEALRQMGCPVSTGVFGAHMEVSLTNDGPVTVLLES